MSQLAFLPGPLIGRERELGLLREFFGQAAVSGGALVMSGEPGVGKTALLNALADDLSASRTMVLRAAGSQFEQEISFAGLNLALLPLLDGLDELSDVHRDALRVALGFGSGAAPDQLLVSNAVLALLRRAAARTPLVLIVDDLPWIDRASAGVLSFAARRLAGRRLALAAYIGAEIIGEMRGTEHLLEAMRQAGPQASDPMHYAPAAAFVMLNADAHIDTIHQLLVGAIEGGNHGYDATDAALVNAMWGLAVVSWLGGRAELWEPFLAMMQLKVAEDRAGRFFGWYFRYVQALLAAVQGRFDTSRALANQVIGWAGPRGVGLAQVWAHYALELADLGAGDFEGAYRHATAMSPAGTLAPYAPHCLWAVMDLVESAVRTHRQAEAERHVHAISEAGIAALSPRLAILAAGSAALVAGDDQAPALFEEALGLPAADQWPFDVARVRLVYGEQLRRLRATSESRIHLEAALAAFQKLGALPWASRAELELRATGRTRMPSRAPDAGALTPQELQIARLAASGMTNKQIAERLFLSPRTVGGHLYQIFPKLGITTRAGLRDALDAVGGSSLPRVSGGGGGALPRPAGRPRDSRLGVRSPRPRAHRRAAGVPAARRGAVPWASRALLAPARAGTRVRTPRPHPAAGADRTGHSCRLLLAAPGAGRSSYQIAPAAVPPRPAPLGWAVTGSGGALIALVMQ
jgi:DNA-binding CsgD family transcriptional regulator